MSNYLKVLKMLETPQNFNQKPKLVMKFFLNCFIFIGLFLSALNAAFLPENPEERTRILRSYIAGGVERLPEAPEQREEILDAVFRDHYLTFMPTSPAAKDKLRNYYANNLGKQIKLHLQIPDPRVQRPTARRMLLVRDEWLRKDENREIGWEEGRQAHHVIPLSYCDQDYLATIWWNIAPLPPQLHEGAESGRLFRLLFPRAAH